MKVTKKEEINFYKFTNNQGYFNIVAALNESQAITTMLGIYKENRCIQIKDSYLLELSKCKAVAKQYILKEYRERGLPFIISLQEL